MGSGIEQPLSTVRGLKPNQTGLQSTPHQFFWGLTTKMCPHNSYEIFSSSPQKCSLYSAAKIFSFSKAPQQRDNAKYSKLAKNASKQVEVKHKCCKFFSSSILIILRLPVFTSSNLSVLYPQSSYLRNLNPLSSEKAGTTLFWYKIQHKCSIVLTHTAYKWVKQTKKKDQD